MPREKKLTRSHRLQKIEKVYLEYIAGKHSSKKKNLNDYQKFVKDESKKEKYKSLKGKERFNAIAGEWKNKTKNSQTTKKTKKEKI